MQRPEPTPAQTERAAERSCAAASLRVGQDASEVQQVLAEGPDSAAAMRGCQERVTAATKPEIEPREASTSAFLESQAAALVASVDKAEEELRMFRDRHAQEDDSVTARQERIGNNLSWLRNAREDAKSKSRQRELDAAILEAQEQAMAVAPLVIEEARLQRGLDVLRQELALVHERLATNATEPPAHVLQTCRVQACPSIERP